MSKTVHGTETGRFTTLPNLKDVERAPRARPYRPQWYPSPLQLEPATHGHIRIDHTYEPVGATVPIVGWRQAMLRGLKPVTTAPLAEPLRITRLVSTGKHHHGVWMTDSPEELNQIYEMVHTVAPRGRVLVGGLGLGCLPLILALHCPRVERIVVVERDQSIVKLCAQSGYQTVHADLYKYLADERRTLAFDYYLLDTWAGTNEDTWWSEVVPLRRLLARRAPYATVHCWAEDIMVGQIRRTLTHLTPERRHWYYKYLPAPMSADAVEMFVRTVGSPEWERRYGDAVNRATLEMRTTSPAMRQLTARWFTNN